MAVLFTLALEMQEKQFVFLNDGQIEPRFALLVSVRVAAHTVHGKAVV